MVGNWTGNRDMNQPEESSAERLRVPPVERFAGESRMFDLAAELLWTWPMLGLPWSAAAIFCFALLAEVQDSHGFLPGPGYSARTCAALP